MKTLIRYGSMANLFLKLNIQRGLEYPTYLIAWLISNPLQFLFGVISIQVVTRQFHSIEGWSFEQILFLYGLGIISHGISIVLFIQTWYMDHLITEGGFDRMLIRPLNVFFQFCFMDFNFIGFTDMIPGIIIFVYGCVSSGFSFTLINTGKIVLILIGATALRGGIYIICGSLAFWIKRSRPLVQINLTLFGYAIQYPLSIFPKAIQGIFTFVFPLGFISFYPSSEFFNINTGFKLIGSLSAWTFVIGIVFYLLSMKLFKRGLGRYESSGS